MQNMVDTHPGLAFLNSAPEFHDRYVETVSPIASYPIWSPITTYNIVPPLSGLLVTRRSIIAITGSS